MSSLLKQSLVAILLVNGLCSYTLKASEEKIKVALLQFNNASEAIRHLDKHKKSKAVSEEHRFAILNALYKRHKTAQEAHKKAVKAAIFKDIFGHYDENL